MIDDEVIARGVELSFVIHLWLEDHGGHAWRGRVTESDGSHSGVFEDEDSLLGFIRSRLRQVSEVELPQKRNVS